MYEDDIFFCSCSHSVVGELLMLLGAAIVYLVVAGALVLLLLAIPVVRGVMWACNRWLPG